MFKQFPHIVEYKQANGRILLNQNYSLEPDPAIFTTRYWQLNQGIMGSAPGRGTTLFVRHQQHELILRHYLRGGLPGKIIEQNYVFAGYNNTRAWQEFSLLQQMLQMQLPVPTPVAAQVQRYGFVYCNHIIVARIAGATDLHQILCKKALADDTYYQIGVTIAQFHKHQVFHHDLNIRNIMLDNIGKVWLIDFDKCRIRRGEHWKQANLARLQRSFVKEKSKLSELHWQGSEWAALLGGYHSG